MGPNHPAPMVNPFATYAIVAAGLFAFLLLIGSLLIWRRSRKRKAERANAISTHPTTSPFRHRGSLPVYTVTPEPSSVYLATPSSWNNQPQSVSHPLDLSVSKYFGPLTYELL